MIQFTGEKHGEDHSDLYIWIYIVLKCTFLLIDNKNGALHSWVAEPYKNACMEKKKIQCFIF